MEAAIWGVLLCCVAEFQPKRQEPLLAHCQAPQAWHKAAIQHTVANHTCTDSFIAFLAYA